LSKTDKYWRIIPTAILGLALYFKLIQQADNEFMFDGAILGGLLLFFLIALMWTNVKDKKEFKETKSRSSYIPTVAGLLFLISIISTDYILKARDSSPILIQAGHDGGFNGCWFEFRKDGTYKFGNSGGIGAVYFRGKYTIKDSVITLDTDSIDNVIKGKRLLILTDHSYIGQQKILVQLNDQDERLYKECRFSINTDNRNK
jgi:hypothetical protein